MLTRTRLPLLLLLLTATSAVASARMPGALRFMLARAAAAAPGDATETDRDRDGLSGPVRRIRTETAKVLVKEGKIVEGPRVVLETATYDMKGVKIDNAYFLSAGGSLTGKEVYKYDDKGNIIEMTLFNADGSVMSKEVYQYEFDAMNNWTKMVTSVAIIENGKLTFEPTEVTYRSISYYLEENVAKKLQPGTQQPAAPVAAAPSSAQAQPVSVVKTNAPAPNNTNTAPAVKLNNAALPNAAMNTGASVALSAPTNNANAGTPANSAAVVKTDDGPPPPAPKAPVKPMSGGVLNGRAVTLPAPEYPEPAKRMRASGLVTVEVVVDVTGRVISAKALTGHTTLRAAAEQAALRARFSPTLLSGQPVKVVGTINYNFAF